VTTTPDEQAGPHPVLVGRKVTLRPGRPGDAPKLRAILAEPSVSRWWAEPDPVEVIEEELRGDDSSVLLVVEIDGKVAGGIQYHEENDPMYRQAGIDIYLSGRFQGRGAGTEAVRLLARFLFSSAATTGSRSTRRPPTSRPSAATPRWASVPSGSCAGTSADPTAPSTTAC
jgi:RimJ/RimL family protein N-acetyltransferase